MVKFAWNSNVKRKINEITKEILNFLQPPESANNHHKYYFNTNLSFWYPYPLDNLSDYYSQGQDTFDIRWISFLGKIPYTEATVKGPG